MIFNICGGRFRLIVKVWYPGREVYIWFFATHEEYDRIDTATSPRPRCDRPEP